MHSVSENTYCYTSNPVLEIKYTVVSEGMPSLNNPVRVSNSLAGTVKIKQPNTTKGWGTELVY